ncbi:MAG: hypothetical protein COB09_18640 [Thalassobium sp.]|nr:MAG: hypothetical protein COB09_18640 [Thalassobium sp.]
MILDNLTRQTIESHIKAKLRHYVGVQKNDNAKRGFMGTRGVSMQTSAKHGILYSVIVTCKGESSMRACQKGLGAYKKVNEAIFAWNYAQTLLFGTKAEVQPFIAGEPRPKRRKRN